MTTIPTEYSESLKKAGLLAGNDPQDIASLTKEKGMRKGKGYSAESIRNFLYRQYTTTEDIAQLIYNYFEAKKQMRDDLRKRQESFTQQLKTEVA